MPFGKRRRLDRSLREKGVAPEPEVRHREQAETHGPYDAADAPDDGQARVDLGALRLVGRPGAELRLNLNQARAVVSVTVRLDGSAMQLGVFAAPRHDGIWDEVRGEIRETIASQGGSVGEQEGRFGTELLATVTSPQGPQPARFVGIDGPRWFLRALITGPAATEPERGTGLEDVLAGAVVVRGTEPMAVRESVPLTLPTDPAAAAAESGADPD